MNLPIHPELGPDFSYNEALNAFAEALNGTSPAPAANQIVQQVLQLGALLLKKNTAYGNSALEPISVFSHGLSAAARMAVRMDDKISRLARGLADGEDPLMDLAGYIVLHRIASVQEVPSA